MGKNRPTKLVFTRHAVVQMFARSISVEDVRAVVDRGETIADYPDDRPYPSQLLLAMVGGSTDPCRAGV